ncbi:fasciclin domain-containing protein [Novosphingobium flavum]|uniref:Fasciclin domain-containing protein n=1 Tax=Novosphingobium flavum TaxID=1778672 RepID=A0A7X1FNH9_9SPHN|nr:fasciclin domain-containing protein [Novosphingobium flavum]MBC2663953.1 fasciclin domain-containing protein [Novosphingobium flavum]
MNKPIYALMLVLAGAGIVAGCKKDGAPSDAASSEAAKPSADTLTKALAGEAQFSTVSGAIKDTGLAGVFEGKASYTLFAPTNAAFAALGDPGKALMAPEQRAALAALLREHIVPGMLTKADLTKALDAAGGKAVKLRSMGKGTLSLSKEGDKIVVTGADGAKGALTAEAASAKNGSALGVDAVLKTVK